MDPAAANGLRLAVKRSTSYGHDRLYVITPDGEIVGWTDLKSGEVKLQRADLAVAFADALDDWRRSNDLTGDA